MIMMVYVAAETSTAAVRQREPWKYWTRHTLTNHIKVATMSSLYRLDDSCNEHAKIRFRMQHMMRSSHTSTLKLELSSLFVKTIRLKGMANVMFPGTSSSTPPSSYMVFTTDRRTDHQGTAISSSALQTSLGLVLSGTSSLIDADWHTAALLRTHF